MSGGRSPVQYNMSYIPPGTNYAAPAASNAALSAASTAGTGAAVGGAVGTLAGPVGTLLGAIAGAAVGGIFDAIQGSLNRKEMRKQQAEAREMAERQFSWGQQMDRFGMEMTGRQVREAEKMNRHQITQDHIDRVNNMLKMNKDMQAHVRSVWGRRQ